MKNFDREKFIEEYKDEGLRLFGKKVEAMNNMEKYDTLVNIIIKNTKNIRNATSLRHLENKEKKIYYFSMEFLMGKLLENYLINLDIKDDVSSCLKELGIELSDLEKEEEDPALGNGGLGRLAACFLDSMSSMGVASVGMGLHFRFGLFKQKIVNGYQVEEPDTWREHGYPWEYEKGGEAVEVRFGGRIERSFENGKITFKHVDYDSVLAIPYDIPIIGFGGKDINILRLWDAQPIKEEIDMDAFNSGHYDKAYGNRSRIEAITSMLYPDDSKEAGKILRLKQEYLLSASGIESIIRKYKETYGENMLHEMGKHISIQINDTHPTLLIPELIRKLIDEEDFSWEDAVRVTYDVCSFTNHTVMQEALERWPKEMIRKILPRIFMIIEEIDRRWIDSLVGKPNYQNLVDNTEIIHNGQIRMAQLSIICSHKVNGVAKLHTDILKNDLFKDFNYLDSNKFTNVTNGVSHRRFLIQSNPNLSNLLTTLIGDDWKKDFSKIKEFEKFKDDTSVLSELGKIKHENKIRLSNYIKEKDGVLINPDSIFDVQVKRMHAYKRQTLNALKCLEMYYELKDNPNMDFVPTTFLFSGKSAPSYEFAKESIKLITSIGELINKDKTVNDKIKLCFIENFQVTNAQIIYPAAEISEQISTAGKEASGTGNMKFMMNGALTLGTLDGANVEIHEVLGDEYIKIFGLRAEDVDRIKLEGGYISKDFSKSDPLINRLVNSLVDDTLLPYGQNFWKIYQALIYENDEYLVLKDLRSYLESFKEVNLSYKDQLTWNKKSLINIANSGMFSSDRSIDDYRKKIWNL